MAATCWWSAQRPSAGLGLGLATDQRFLQLLTVNPEHRLASLQDMQAAPALADVLWDELSEKKVEPGFVPNVSLVGPRGPWVGWGAAVGSVPCAPAERPPALRPHL